MSWVSVSTIVPHPPAPASEECMFWDTYGMPEKEVSAKLNIYYFFPTYIYLWQSLMHTIVTERG